MYKVHIAFSSPRLFPLCCVTGVNGLFPVLSCSSYVGPTTIPQEERLRGLGAAIPPHAARQAKRDREWREFLDRRAPEQPSNEPRTLAPEVGV